MSTIDKARDLGTGPGQTRALSTPAPTQRARFASALHTAQRRCRNDEGRGESRIDDACESETLASLGDIAPDASATWAAGLALANQTRSATAVSTGPAAGPAARARAPARGASAGRESRAHEADALEVQTTIELVDPLQPDIRLKLTLEQTGGTGWALRCDAATLASLRSALARLADRFEQRALGRLDVRLCHTASVPGSP